MLAKKLITGLLAGLTALALMACEGESLSEQPVEETNETVPLESVEIGFILSSFSQDDGVVTSTEPITGETTLEGSLLVVDANTGGEQTYQWAIKINEASLDVPTKIDLGLEKGTYHLYFLVSAAGLHYGGRLENWIVLEGENLLPITLYPVLGGDNVQVSDLNQMAAVKFSYSKDAVETYTAPRFAVSLDEGAETVYTLNLNTWLSDQTVYVNSADLLVNGRFFDGYKEPVVVEPPPPPPLPEPPAPLVVTAYRQFKEREYAENEIDLLTPHVVRVPYLEDVVLLQGDPTHWVFFLELGEALRCKYQAGAVEVNCNDTSVRAGDIITITDEVSGRVVTGSPHEPVTEVQATIEVLEVQ